MTAAGVPASATLARVAAERARLIRFEDIPGEVVETAKDLFLDQLGVGLAASSLAGGSVLSAAVPQLGTGGRSTGLGLAAPLPAASAALRNGTLMHSLEYDGTHAAAIVHGGSVTAPAALAMAEQESAPGRELLRAFVLGWELFIRLGLAAPGRFQERGFQLTGVAGPFVAALVSGLLLRLSTAETVHGLGIAGSQGSGVFEFVAEGATVKGLHAGWAAHGGIVAAALARAGMTGPSSIFDGRFGVFNTYADAADGPDRLRALLGTLGTIWRLEEIAVKEYACCHYIQPFLECLANLLRDGLDPDEIATVHCEVPRGEEFLICEPWEDKRRPISAYQAKFSLCYALAGLLVDGRVDLDTFEGRTRPELCAAAERVTWAPMEGSDFPNRFQARLSVTTTAGETRDAEVDDVRGGPGRRFARPEIHRKFREDAARALPADAVERVFEEVMGLDRAPDPTALTAALRNLA